VLQSWRIVVVLVAVVLGAGACSDDEEPSSDEPTSSSTSADTGIISPELPEIPKFDGKTAGVIDDVVVDSCDTEAGAVAASGSATNSSGDTQDIVVVISWAVTTTSDVVARGVATLEDVEAGDTVPWSVAADLASGHEVACVPTALRGSLR
jgi:hypothetical protein